MSATQPTLTQPMLFEAEVSPTGRSGEAVIRAGKPILQGSVDRARSILGGRDVVSRSMVYRLVREGKIRAWKPRGNAEVERRDGRGSNAKMVIDLESVYRHLERVRGGRDD